jgi:glycosyltransferase involved in cell wall biosynthesis
MANAYALVFPSLCYENAPAVLSEALACGLPVIASRLGSAGEIVEDSRAGLLFDAGDAEALAGAVAELRRDTARRGALSAAARAHHDARLTPAEGYRRLIAAYARALKRRQQAG